jgi:hypothetical protein
MATEADGVPRVPKVVSKYSPAKEAKKKKSGGPEAVVVETLLREMTAQVGALQTQATLAEERAAEYRRQTGALRDQKRAAEERAAGLAGELESAKASLEQLQAAHRAALGRLAESEEGRKAAEAEREALRERGRVATVSFQAEQSRAQEQLAQAMAQMATLGGELSAAEKRAAELAERLEASRRECEGLRARAAEPGELEVQRLRNFAVVVNSLQGLRQDRGAAERLAAVRGELERSRAGEAAEAKARDEWRRKCEEAETQLRLERAGRADEGRLAREKLGQQEVRREKGDKREGCGCNLFSQRATTRVEEALRAATERAAGLAQQLSDERAARRAAEDDRLKLQARVRGLEGGVKQLEGERARAASLLGRDGGEQKAAYSIFVYFFLSLAGGGGSREELLRLDLVHAQRRAEDAERHEKRARDEERQEKERREAAEAALAAAQRQARLAAEVSRERRNEMQRPNALHTGGRARAGAAGARGGGGAQRGGGGAGPRREGRGGSGGRAAEGAAAGGAAGRGGARSS